MKKQKRSTFDAARAWLADALVHPDAKRRAWTGDNLENVFLGFGTTRDKLAYGSFTQGTLLTDLELDALYYSDDVAAKIVNKRPDEMLRRGYKLTSEKNQGAADELQKRGEAEDLQVSKKILRASQWGRWRGGAALVLGANDSPDLSKPLRPEGVRDLKFVNVVDRRYAQVVRWQDNPALPRLGDPELFSIGSPFGGMQMVHASRVVRFVGVEETDPITMRQLGGWTHSVLQRPYEIVRSFAMQFKAVEHMMSDASQGVWKIQNLIDMLGANRDELMTRMAFADMTRSAGRAIMLDAENEDFQKIATSFAGVGDVIDRTIQRLAAAAEMPVTLLMGRSPAGMNATGDSDFRAWYDVLDTERVTVLKPAILSVYRAMARGQIDDLDVEFPPLWQPTAKEKADTDLTIAQTDKIYFDMGSVQPEEIAIARFGSGNGKIEIDEDALNVSLDQEIELMKDPEARAAKEAKATEAAAPLAQGSLDPLAAPNDPNVEPPKQVSE